MGCCLSRTTSSTNPTSPKNADRRSCPPPQLEEETVKEVLTENPSAAVLYDKHLRKNGAVEKFEVKASGEMKCMRIEEVVEVKQKQKQQRIEAVEIESVDVQVSEITVATENRSAAAAVSESVSAASAGGEEVMSKSSERDRAEVVNSRYHQRLADQSAAKVPRRRPHSGELRGNWPKEPRVRSPAKRALASPEKNIQLGRRAVRGRSQSPAMSKPRNAVGGGPARIRRDGGERSGRRSRSPATNASSNRNGGGWEGNGSKRGMAEQEETADESLDNPWVSLECFIFL